MAETVVELVFKADCDVVVDCDVVPDDCDVTVASEDDAAVKCGFK